MIGVFGYWIGIISILQCWYSIGAFHSSFILRKWPLSQLHPGKDVSRKHRNSYLMTVPVEQGPTWQKENVGTIQRNSKGLKVLISDLRKCHINKNFPGLLDTLCKISVSLKTEILRKDDKNEIRSTLIDWTKLNHGTGKVLSLLRVLKGIISVTDVEDHYLLGILVGSALNGSLIPIVSFPWFLQSLQNVNYRWIQLETHWRQRIIRLFRKICSDPTLTATEFNHILFRLDKLDMPWKDVDGSTWERLLSRLKEFYPNWNAKQIFFLVSVFTKAGVNINRHPIKDVFLDMIVHALERNEKEGSFSRNAADSVKKPFPFYNALLFRLFLPFRSVTTLIICAG
jgi:hypothetical protein